MLLWFCLGGMLVRWGSGSSRQLACVGVRLTRKGNPQPGTTVLTNPLEVDKGAWEQKTILLIFVERGCSVSDQTKFCKTDPLSRFDELYSWLFAYWLLKVEQNKPIHRATYLLPLLIFNPEMHNVLENSWHLMYLFCGRQALNGLVGWIKIGVFPNGKQT